jgi:hypothetical protein
MIVKKKTFDTENVLDVRGFLRPITKQKEELVEIVPVSKKRFSIEKNGTIKTTYSLPETAEYIFEFGTVDLLRLNYDNVSVQELVDEFNKEKVLVIEKYVRIKADISTDYWTLSSRCIGESEECTYDSILRSTGCDVFSNEACLEGGK